MNSNSNLPEMQDRTGQVRAVVRAMALLREIASTDGGLSLTEVADRTQLPPSTTHRLLTTLESERFVRYDMAAGVWQIGVSAFVTGAAFVRTRNLLHLAKPYLRRLVDMTGETANIFIESGGQVVCLDQVESRHAMRAITQVGGRLPLHASGSGKALLSMMPGDRCERMIASAGLASLTPATITDRVELSKVLRTAREQGYACDDGEHAEGLRCAASVIFGETAEPVAAISVSGPQSRLDDSRMGELGGHVRQIAREVTSEYGGRLP